MSATRTVLSVGLACIAFAAPRAQATDLIVNPGQSIQTAINSAVNGDRVLIQPGTYLEAPINLLGKSIELIGVGGAPATNLDGSNAAVANVLCASGEPATTVIQGLTLRNCSVGIYLAGSSKPTIRACIIEDHHILVPAAQESGDGIHSAFPAKDALVVDCLIRNNDGSGVEGPVDLLRCVVSGNKQTGYSAFFGGTGDLRECRFTGNSGSIGGAISVGDNFSPSPFFTQVIDRCVIEDNSAVQGGGIWGNGIGGLHVTNSRIVNNHATVEGGGIYLRANNSSKLFSNAVVQVRNCVIAGNTATTGAGVHLTAIAFSTPFNGTVLLERTTLSDNQPDGAFLSGAKENFVKNCIVWNQPSPFPAFSTPTVTFSDIEGGFPGTGNFNADPLFVDAANDDYHLRSTSPCIDAGDGAASSDFEGDATAGAVDVGGDEFAPHVSLTGDTAPGGTVRLGIYGKPGAAPVLFFISTARLDPGIPTPYGPFGLGFPLIPGFPIDLGAMPAGSAIAFPAVIPAIAPPGVSLHMQVYLGSGGGAVSKLTNVESFVIG